MAKSIVSTDRLSKPMNGGERSQVTRRLFLRFSAAVAGGSIFAACRAPTAQPSQVTVAVTSTPTAQVTRSTEEMGERRPAGDLRGHPEDYHYFLDGDRPVVLMGRYHADFICSTYENFTKDIPTYMSYLTDEINVNFTQVWAIMIFGGREEAEYGVNTGGAMYMPFLRTGPGKNYYGDPKYDLTRYDEAYFAKFHEFLRATREQGIYTEITLFDICGLKSGGTWYGAFDPRWQCNPFHPNNNINDLGLPADHAVGADRFFSLRNAKLLAVQQAYVDHLLDELGGYGHVIFNVCNEYDGPFDWQEHWVRRIKEKCPDRVVAVNNLDRRGVPSGIEHPIVDVLNYHPGGGETVELRGITRRSGRGGRKAILHHNLSKAILSDTDGYHPHEFGVDPDAEIRKLAWSCFMNGQHFADMSHSGRADGLLHVPPLPTFQHILPFVEQVDFVHAAPHHELLSNSNEGECLAQPGVEYIVYLRYGGPGTLDTSHCRQPLRGRWYNPRTGEWSNPFTISPAYETRLLPPGLEEWDDLVAKAVGYEDWALHLKIVGDKQG